MTRYSLSYFQRTSKVNLVTRSKKHNISFVKISVSNAWIASAKGALTSNVYTWIKHCSLLVLVVRVSAPFWIISLGPRNLRKPFVNLKSDHSSLLAPDLEKMTASELSKMAAFPDQRHEQQSKKTSVFCSCPCEGPLWGPPVRAPCEGPLRINGTLGRCTKGRAQT